MFLQVSVILFTGGVPAPRGFPASGGGLVPGGWCLLLGGVWFQGGLVPGGSDPWGLWSRGVPGVEPPDGYCCGQYASYWNAFLCKVQFHVKNW